MNWRRAYATFQIWFVLLLASAFTAGCNTVVVVGICRLVLNLSDDVSVFLVGIAVFYSIANIFQISTEATSNCWDVER